MSFPENRMRRLRKSDAMRRLVRETRLSPDCFIYPIFVSEAISKPEEIAAMPDIYKLPLKDIVGKAKKVWGLGISAVLLFGIPAEKDDQGSSSLEDNGIIQLAVKEIKSALPDLLVITDVCLCEYTSHGHCGIVSKNNVDNDTTINVLAQQALSHVKAGADIVAPSDMMDGRVQAIRNKLDDNGYSDRAIMSYAAKYCSAFYGPFREAVDSAPQFGDRQGYQMDPANTREAIREIELDIEEGADIVMVKPALSYLDVIAQIRHSYINHPLAAYNVSGEYSMVKLMTKADLADEKRLVLEILTSIKRAGADIIITYHALDAARWLQE